VDPLLRTFAGATMTAYHLFARLRCADCNEARSRSSMIVTSVWVAKVFLNAARTLQQTTRYMFRVGNGFHPTPTPDAFGHRISIAFGKSARVPAVAADSQNCWYSSVSPTYLDSSLPESAIPDAAECWWRPTVLTSFVTRRTPSA
jgi:hypothetical protein